MHPENFSLWADFRFSGRRMMDWQEKATFIELQKYHGKLIKKSHPVGSTKVEYNDPKVCQGVWECSHTACGKQEGRSEEDFLFSFHAIYNCGVLSCPQEAEPHGWSLEWAWWASSRSSPPRFIYLAIWPQVYFTGLVPCLKKANWFCWN